MCGRCCREQVRLDEHTSCTARDGAFIPTGGATRARKRCAARSRASLVCSPSMCARAKPSANLSLPRARLTELPSDGLLFVAADREHRMPFAAALMELGTAPKGLRPCAVSYSFVRDRAPSARRARQCVRARRASARDPVLQLCGGACQSSRADRQHEGTGAAREAIGGAPSAHMACCGWNRGDGLPAGSPRTVSGLGAIWRFEHASRGWRDRARSIVSRGC